MKKQSYTFRLFPETINQLKKKVLTASVDRGIRISLSTYLETILKKELNK